METIDKWIDLIGWSWFNRAGFLADRLTGPNVAPARGDVFQALREVAPEDIRVVILGQDPYPTPGRARGVAFGYHPEYKGQPVSSLANIMDESGATDITLRSWTEQGVLLLNTRLTVEHGKPMSHAGLGWEPLVQELITELLDRPIVWILLGGEARKVYHRARRETRTNGIALTTSHPCKFSAHRGFLGSGIFRDANDTLMSELGYFPIKWNATIEQAVERAKGLRELDALHKELHSNRSYFEDSRINIPQVSQESSDK